MKFIEGIIIKNLKILKRYNRGNIMCICTLCGTITNKTAQELNSLERRKSETDYTCCKEKELLNSTFKEFTIIRKIPDFEYGQIGFEIKCNKCDNIRQIGNRKLRKRIKENKLKLCENEKCDNFFYKEKNYRRQLINYSSDYTSVFETHSVSRLNFKKICNKYGFCVNDFIEIVDTESKYKNFFYKWTKPYHEKIINEARYCFINKDKARIMTEWKRKMALYQLNIELCEFIKVEGSNRFKIKLKKDYQQK